MAVDGRNTWSGVEAYRITMLVGLAIVGWLVAREMGRIDKTAERSEQTIQQLSDTTRTVDELGVSIERVDGNVGVLAQQVNALTKSVDEMRALIGVKPVEPPEAVRLTPPRPAVPKTNLSIPEDRARQKWQRK